MTPLLAIPPVLIRLAAGAAIVVACALSIAGLEARQARERLIPPDVEMERAVAVVQQAFQPGDQIRVVPRWMEHVWHKLSWGPKGVPQGALHQGERVDPIALIQAKRLWVIGGFERTPSLDFEHLKLSPPLREETFGNGVSVALYDVPQRPSLAQLSKQLNRTKLTLIHTNGKTEACTVRGATHRCPGDKGPRMHMKRDDVYHREVNWPLWLPSPDGATLSLEWTPRLPAGAKKAHPQMQLVVRAGLTLAATRTKGGGPVTVAVFVDDRPVGTLVFEPRDYVLGRLSAPVGSESRIRIALSTPDHRARWTMVEADIIAEPLPAELMTGWMEAP